MSQFIYTQAIYRLGLCVILRIGSKTELETSWKKIGYIFFQILYVGLCKLYNIQGTFLVILQLL